MDNFPISSNSLEKFFYIDGNQLGQQYKEYLSGYKTWDQKEHAPEWILFPDNIGPYLSLDETALSNGKLYTVLTNKEGKGKKRTLIAMIEGTGADKVIAVIKPYPGESQGTCKRGYAGYGRINEQDCKTVLPRCFKGNRSVSCPKTGLRCTSENAHYPPLGCNQ